MVHRRVEQQLRGGRLDAALGRLGRRCGLGSAAHAASALRVFTGEGASNELLEGKADALLSCGLPELRRKSQIRVSISPQRCCRQPSLAGNRTSTTGDGRMRIASWSWGGRDHVGLISPDGSEATPLAVADAARGALSLIRALAAGKPCPPPAGPVCRWQPSRCARRCRGRGATCFASAATTARMPPNWPARCSATALAQKSRVADRLLQSAGIA